MYFLCAKFRNLCNTIDLNLETLHVQEIGIFHNLNKIVFLYIVNVFWSLLSNYMMLILVVWYMYMYLALFLNRFASFHLKTNYPC